MSSQQSNTAANRALVNRVTDIGKVVEGLGIKVASLELDKSMLRDRLDTLEEANESAEKAARQMSADLNTQERRIGYLQSLIQVSNAATHTRLPPDLLDGDEDANLVDPNLASDGADGIALTADEGQIQQDRTLKKVVYKCLCVLCGVPHLHDLCYMAFPLVDEAHPDWPSTTDEKNERRPFMRLDYSQPFDEPRNWTQLIAWADYTMHHGASVTSEAEELLSKLSIEQIRTACKLRFRYLAKDFRKKMRGVVAAPAAPATRNENDPTIDPALEQLDVAPTLPAAPPYPATPIPELRSRANGKYKLRAVKRVRLTGDEAKFQGPKYDSYFQPGAMSDDEDKYNLVDNMWVKVPNLFESREYEFISVEMRQCRNAVDTIPNPSEKSRPTPRIRGLPKPGPPRKATAISWALRAWMIDPRVLAENTWLKDGLVLSNGVPRGDGSEPTLPKSRYESKKRRRVEESQAGPSNALIENARKARRAVQEAQRQAQELQEQPGGADPMSEADH